MRRGAPTWKIRRLANGRRLLLLSNGRYCDHADGDRRRLFALEQLADQSLACRIRPKIAGDPSSSCATAASHDWWSATAEPKRSIAGEQMTTLFSRRQG
jgi:hypothetical protein